MLYSALSRKPTRIKLLLKGTRLPALSRHHNPPGCQRPHRTPGSRLQSGAMGGHTNWTSPERLWHGPPGAPNHDVSRRCHLTAVRQPPSPVLSGVRPPLPSPTASRCKARSGGWRLRGESSESPGTGWNPSARHSKPHRTRAENEFWGRCSRKDSIPPSSQRDLDRRPQQAHCTHTR